MFHHMLATILHLSCDSAYSRPLCNTRLPERAAGMAWICELISEPRYLCTV